MSEQIDDQDPRVAIAERVKEQLAWLNQAAEIIGGAGARVEDVFPEPPTVRREAPEPDWNEEQITGVREIAHKLGYGAEQNVPTGLVGGFRLLEGGLAWKMEAEAAALAEEDAGAIVFSASPERAITREDELAHLQEKHGLNAEGMTEYDAARFIADKLVTKYDERVIAFGYKVAEGNASTAEPTGQVICLGTSETNQPVYLYRVDRENYVNDEGKNRYRYQPPHDRQLAMIHEVLAQDSPGNQEPAGYMTSNAYAENEEDTVLAGLELGIQAVAGKYGRSPLAEIRGIEMLPDVELNQVPGGLRRKYENLKRVESKLAA